MSREGAIQSIKIALDNDPDIASIVPNGAVYIEGMQFMRPPSIVFDVVDDPVRRCFGGVTLSQMQVTVTVRVGKDEGIEGAEALSALVERRLHGQEIGSLGVFSGVTSIIDRGQAARGTDSNSVTSVYSLRGS